MPKLSELDFSDIYVRLDARGVSRYSPTPRRGLMLPRNMPVPPEFDMEIDLLRAHLLKQEHDDFALDLEEMRMRGSRCILFGEETWVALRRLPLDPPELDKLNFRPDILAQLKSLGQRTGLIVVGGATRAGKTTTMVGMLAEFLRVHGGVACTIEDPVEYYLQGAHGVGGYCFQREVHADPEWGEAVKASLRWAPRYISLGEVRTPAAAKWLLRAATSGHLAMCTVHGGSIEETLSAILQIAQTELGSTASTILADGLCTVVHQSIVQGVPNVHLLSTEGEAGTEVRAKIRGGKLEQLGTQIKQQSILRQQAHEEETSGGASGGGRSQGSPGRGGPPPGQPERRQTPRPPQRSAVPPPSKKKFGIF